MAKNSVRLPIQSLNPIGLPSDKSLSCFTKPNISIGVEKAECAGGEFTSKPSLTRRILATSAVTFFAGNMPP